MKTTRIFKIFPLFLIAAMLAGASAPALAQKSRLEERLTRLFYWQMSQALDLSTAEEKRMTDTMNEISQRRLAAIDHRDQVFAKMTKCLGKSETSPPASEVSKLLAEYRQQLDATAKIDVEEHEKLRALLGDVRLLKFYHERKNIIERIKKALN